MLNLRIWTNIIHIFVVTLRPMYTSFPDRVEVGMSKPQKELDS